MCVCVCVCVYLLNCVCVFIKLHITAQSGLPCHPSHSMPLALILPRGSMILVTKTSDQTRVCVCVCVFKEKSY